MNGGESYIEKETTIYLAANTTVHSCFKYKYKYKYKIQIEGESNIEKRRPFGSHYLPLVYTLASVSSLKEGRGAVKRFEKGEKRLSQVIAAKRIMMFLHKAASNIRAQDDQQHLERMKGVIKPL